MRFIPFALLASAALLVQAAPGFGREVDLDAPGALERVRQEQPDHAHAIARILREAPGRKPQAIAGWVRTAFDARMASAMLVKTSYPPQARLAFTLEDTAYLATITLRNVEPAMYPAEGR